MPDITPASDSTPLDNGAASDIDRLLEAERTVHELAHELQRMRTAAELLDSSQQKVDALLRSADAIVRSAGRFTDDSVAILQRLQAIDLESRLGEILRASAETQALMSRQLDRLNEAISQLRERSKEDVGALKEEVNTTLRSNFEQLHKSLQQQAEQSQRTVEIARQETAQLKGEVGGLKKLMVGFGVATVLLLFVTLMGMFLR